jgi:probable addiction module antidote protein
MGSIETRRHKIELRPWDPAEHMHSEEDMIGYLNAVLDEDDHAVLMFAIGDVARAKGMTQVARETGLGRESLYKSLSAQGNPEFATVQKVLKSLGLQLRVASLGSDPSGDSDTG